MHISSLFVSSNQSDAGSIVITLGLMHLLKSKINKVAFFRPVIATLQAPDSDIRFMLEYFDLAQTYDESYGVTKDELESLVADGKLSEALSIIIDKFTKLKSKKNFVLIEGMAQSEHTQNLGFDINLELGKNLDTDFISIINAKHKTSDQILNEIKLESESIKHHGVRQFMIIANRVHKQEYESVFNALKNHDDVYCSPEIDELSSITINEIKTRINCDLLFGSEQDLNKIVSTKLIGAMSGEHYLEHISEKALIIVPSDRSDIITSTILALYSKNIPNVSGIVLTGSTALPESIVKLLLGLDSLSLPILSTSMDTYSAAITINEIKAKILPSSERKIALALGLFFDNVDTEKLLTKLDTDTEHIMTPAMFEYNLFKKARSSKKTIVLPESHDERILRAVEIILHRGVADILLLGNPDEIKHRSGILGLDLSKASIIDPETSELRERFSKRFYDMRRDKGLQLQAARDAMTHGNYFATMLVYEGLADGMVSGAIHATADTIRPALQIIKTKPDVSVVSSIFFMCLDTTVLIYGDCAVNQNPDESQLAQIAISSAQTARSFGIEPCVAMLSYSTGESGNGQDVEKVKSATRIVREMAPDLLIEGPIQYDAAIDPKVAFIKLPDSKIAGKANVFIFPDLNTGNNTYKAVQRSSGAVAIGPILQGLNKPVNDLSRGCSVTDIINTVAITAIQAQYR